MTPQERTDEVAELIDVVMWIQEHRGLQSFLTILPGGAREGKDQLSLHERKRKNEQIENLVTLLKDDLLTNQMKKEGTMDAILTFNSYNPFLDSQVYEAVIRFDVSLWDIMHLKITAINSCTVKLWRSEIFDTYLTLENLLRGELNLVQLKKLKESTKHVSECSAKQLFSTSKKASDALYERIGGDMSIIHHLWLWPAMIKLEYVLENGALFDPHDLLRMLDLWHYLSREEELTMSTLKWPIRHKCFFEEQNTDFRHRYTVAYDQAYMLLCSACERRSVDSRPLLHYWNLLADKAYMRLERKQIYEHYMRAQISLHHLKAKLMAEIEDNSKTVSPSFKPGSGSPESPALSKTEIQTDTAKGSGIRATKDRFSLTPGQLLFDGKDLELPTGLAIDVAAKLISHYGAVVPYGDLDDNSIAKEASEQLRKAKSAVVKLFKKHNIPCQIYAKRSEGYVISDLPPATNDSQTIHKRVTTKLRTQ